MEMAILRQTLYKYLGSLFLYPNQKLIEDIKRYANELLENKILWGKLPYQEVLQLHLDEVQNIDIDDYDEIINEHNRLFSIKPVASPYETQFMEKPGQQKGHLAAEISGIYGNAGLSVDPNTNELPDHITVELEFMSFLCGKEVEGYQLDDAEMINSAISQQKAFIESHLSKWFPKFAKKTLEESNSSFISNIVKTVFSFIHNEIEFLELRG